jgi:hypothetical protein
MPPVFVANRKFDADAGARWAGYLVWSGLHQLQELVSLDTVLCPTVPEQLEAEDWEHNVQADYQISYFRSLEYLRKRVAGEPGLNILAVLQNPSPADLESVELPGFRFLGFDLLDVHGDISALSNCGGFEGVFAGSELSEHGLLPGLPRAYEVQHGLSTAYPDEPHARCDVWAIWRLEPGE